MMNIFGNAVNITFRLDGNFPLKHDHEVKFYYDN